MVWVSYLRNCRVNCDSVVIVSVLRCPSGSLSLNNHKCHGDLQECGRSLSTGTVTKRLVFRGKGSGKDLSPRELHCEIVTVFERLLGS